VELNLAILKKLNSSGLFAMQIFNQPWTVWTHFLYFFILIARSIGLFYRISGSYLCIFQRSL